jgi:hypothetical protein
MYSIYLLYCDAALMHVYTHIYKALPVRYKCIYIWRCTWGSRCDAYVSIRQHMSAYVSIRQHMLAYLGVALRGGADALLRQY